MGEQLASTANAGLDLVEDQEQPLIVAKLAQCTQILIRNRTYATLALDRLDQNGGGFRANRCFQRLHITERNLVEAFDLRSETFEIFQLTTGGNRRQASGRERRLQR